MRIRALIAVTTGITAAALVLAGCSSPLDKFVDGLDEITEQLEDLDITDVVDEVTDDETEDDVVEVPMPSGFPADLPLPDGTLTVAMRNAKNFSLVYAESTVAGIDAVVQSFTSKGWELVEDVELYPAQVWTFGSPETNDYGHIRKVTLGFNSEDFSSTYFLDVRDD
jgi:hypothetical protein